MTISRRLWVSAAANIIRSLLGFVATLFIARNLNPKNYGDIMFLLGSFSALRLILDMGSSNAYYTLLSQRLRPLKFHITYFVWQLFQFTIASILIWLVIPDFIFAKLWLTFDRNYVMLAFIAVFMQQQIWQMINSIGESARKTTSVQVLNVIVSSTYLISIYISDSLTVQRVLFLIAINYAISSCIAIFHFRNIIFMPSYDDLTHGKIFEEFWIYCHPLILVSIIGFVYEFLDKWLLQLFGGSFEQGIFQISNQIAAVSLIFTTSVLRVFWKEIAWAWAHNDYEVVFKLHRRISRVLVMFSAIISGFLIPWSKQIILLTLGQRYIDSWQVLAIMLLYPIPQSLGQIGGTMLLASGATRKNLTLSVIHLFIAVPITYLILAPPSTILIPGLGLGALGMAINTVFLAVVSANIQAWVISRYCNWTFDWIYQIVGIPIILISGYSAKFIAFSIIEYFEIYGNYLIFIHIALMGFLYTVLLILIVWSLPWLFDLNRKELQQLVFLRRRRQGGLI